MAQGTIKNLIRDRGYGFITPDAPGGSSDDLFFHRNDVQGPVTYDRLRLGERIEYELGRDERRGGSKAINVRGAAEG